MNLNYNNHDLSVNYNFSDNHYYCSKCEMYLYDPLGGSYNIDITPWVLSFTMITDISGGKIHNDMKGLTCEEIIIKKLLE